MSNPNGIASLQQALGAINATATTGVSKAGKAESATLTRGGKGDSSTTQVDDAHLSSTASVMAQALSSSDVRTEKVAALQQAISAGTYSVPAGKVADKLMNSLLD